MFLQTSAVSGSNVTTLVSSWNEYYSNVINVCKPCLSNWEAWLLTDLSSWTKWVKTAAQFLVGTRCTYTFKIVHLEILWITNETIEYMHKLHKMELLYVNHEKNLIEAKIQAI